MERLVTTSQAAQILGLSLQGVHYRIKNNQLKSIKKSGKTYVYISEHVQDKSNIDEKPVEIIEIREIIKVKDEQISLLKKNIKWMKHQYTSEIKRLEKNQKRIIEVFNREIQLLQSAFNEMRSIYKPQIQISSQEETEPKKQPKYLSLLEFTKLMKTYGKSDTYIKSIIINGIKNQDSRFYYNKQTKKILIKDSDFKDFL
ncbi:helix-turn-helix domain-containing protein [Malaciobacter mytili]|uniref:DNA-binding protein n=1 Tax=Malaciobacter mytili LMG 24559 TaxID=1032238 RepID=A0AAX2AC97_9BACT|nr:helix-turn-helix domain-containing protein [Malaciobacter mytili]AXH13642.1 hypothetical protein AMYT_0014 [Malaciobacter mytili LMG 24559]RXI44673.1 DNA-binding protein [Malaciobacter mytili]RXK13826.1 DNA-binding protein [Malaciobacter mytili LMG 24559]